MGALRLPAPAPALIEDYRDLIANVIARRRQLNLSQLDVDHIAGWPDSYMSKLEISAKPDRARNARALGRESFPLLMGSLNVRLVMVDDGKLGMPTHAETALLLTRSPSKEAEMSLHEYQRHTIDHDADEPQVANGAFGEEAEAELEDAGCFDWTTTLDGIRRLSARERESEARVRAAEERARRAEERAAHAELGLRRLHQAVIEASR